MREQAEAKIREWSNAAVKILKPAPGGLTELPTTFHREQARRRRRLRRSTISSRWLPPTATNIASEAEATVAASRMTMITASASACSLGLMLAIGFAYSLSRPIGALAKSMLELAEGDFHVVLPGLDRKDEIGLVARAVERFKVLAEQRAREEAEAKMEQDQVRSPERRKADMRRLADRFEAVRRRDREDRVGDLDRARGFGRRADGDGRARARSWRPRSSRRVRRSFHQCAVGRVRDRAAVVLRQRDQPSGAGLRADGPRGGRSGPRDDRTGQRVVQGRDPDRRCRRTDQRHCRPDQSAGAERHHRGRACRRGRPRVRGGRVRSEGASPSRRRKPPERSANRSRESRPRHKESVSAIKEISGTIERLAEMSSAIASAVEEQGAATLEISRNVQHAANGTRKCRPTSRDVEQGASETGAASSRVLSAAQLLSSDSLRLKLEVEKFLSTVRAA